MMFRPSILFNWKTNAKGIAFYGIIAALCLLDFTGWSRAETSVILEQKNAPITIVSYSAAFSPAVITTAFSHYDQVDHKVKIRNSETKQIVAHVLGFVTFDAFNRFLSISYGWGFDSINPEKEKGGSWAFEKNSPFRFQKFGTGIAFVDAVRFSDGSIWFADKTKILEELRKFESNLQMDIFIDSDIGSDPGR